MSNKISDKDKRDWKNFISDKNSLPDKDESSQKKKIQKSIIYDLHGYSLDRANIKIKQIIIKSYQNGIRKLIIVTGKGLHSENDKNPYLSKYLIILKYSVPEYIRSDDELMSMITEIRDADNEDGGSGAFYIFLKKFTK